jgi:hypothetical protein
MSEYGGPPSPPPPPGDGGYPPPPPPGGGYPPPPPGGGYPPPGGSYPPAAGPPQNYLVWAILSTICCCLPLGVASIVFASQVNSKWSGGDFAGAYEASKKAKTFAIWATVAGVVVNVLVSIIYIVAAASQM